MTGLGSHSLHAREVHLAPRSSAGSAPSHSRVTLPRPAACPPGRPPRVGPQPARASQCLPPVTISRQVNTTVPARTLLFGWGPYAVLYLSATVTDVSAVSPKLQMVQTPPGPRVRTRSISVSLRLAPSLFPAFWPPGSLFLSSLEHFYCTGNLLLLGATRGCTLTLPWPRVRGQGQPRSGTKAKTGAQDGVCFPASSANWSRRPWELQNPARDR